MHTLVRVLGEGRHRTLRAITFAFSSSSFCSSPSSFHSSSSAPSLCLSSSVSKKEDGYFYHYFTEVMFLSRLIPWTITVDIENKSFAWWTKKHDLASRHDFDILSHRCVWVFVFISRSASPRSVASV
jgi:hypothetical protein